MKYILMQDRTRLRFTVARGKKDGKQDVRREQEYFWKNWGKKEDILREKPSSIFFNTDEIQDCILTYIYIYIYIIHIYAFKKYKCQTCLYFIHLVHTKSWWHEKKIEDYVFISAILRSSRALIGREFFEKLNHYMY